MRPVGTSPTIGLPSQLRYRARRWFETRTLLDPQEMTDVEGSVQWPDDFCGQVRLFPLPNLVLFPGVIQPLHIFEPRYCEMLADALASDGLIAMALLEKGWESSYQSRPKVASTLCVGKILSHSPTEDGRHNILLVGMKRALLREELDADKAYRQAIVEIKEDCHSPDDEHLRSAVVARLQELFSHFVPEGLAAQESFQALVGRQLPLGVLTDTISYAMDLPIAMKQQLLAEYNVDIRARILMRCLEQQLKSVHNGDSLQSEDFPPRFSDN